MKKIILIILSLMSSYGAIAQKISFVSDVADAGTTLWKSPVTVSFTFTNKEKTPLVIKNVDAGCGCIRTEWTKGNIAKGASGEIRITYDAQTLGHYDRFVDVFTNASDKPEQVRMKGIISMTEDLNVEELFPYVIDNVRVSTNNIEFPDIHSNDSAKVSIEVYNAGRETYTPQLMHMPEYISMVAKPAKISRAHRAIIELTVHGDKVPVLGLNQTSVYVPRFPGDKVGTNNDITISTIKLSNAPLPSGKLAPKMELSTTELILDSHGALAKTAAKLGVKPNVLSKVGIKAKLKGTVEITNKGLVSLNLTNIQAFNRAITISVPKTTIGPGETVVMKVVVDGRFLGESKAQPRILLITDDPAMPKAIIDVTFQ